MQGFVPDTGTYKAMLYALYYTIKYKIAASHNEHCYHQHSLAALRQCSRKAVAVGVIE